MHDGHLGGSQDTKNSHDREVKPSGERRALIIVDEEIGGEELRDSLLRHLGERPGQVFVIAPALADSGLKHIMGDVDEAIEPAGERLQSTLEKLREAGLPASGEVGDSDPIQAIGDGIVKFDPDEIAVVAHRDEEGAFAERDLLERAERDFSVPVLELVVGAADSSVIDVHRSEPMARRRRERRPSRNLPPLSRREIAGIIIAILGTILLGVLATKGVANSGSPTGDHEEGRLGAEAAAMVLIALGMALINLAHVVGLFLFQSVRYEGIFSRFFARLSLFGTPVAIVVSLVLLGLT